MNDSYASKRDYIRANVWKENEYNGWHNYYTWNVALWINNTESLYRAAVRYVETKREKHQVKYSEFISLYALDGHRTGDGVPYNSKHLCLRELNEMLRELWYDFHEKRD